MNPQPVESTVNLFTIILLGMIIYFACNKKYHYQIKDTIELGYIYDNHISNSVAVSIEHVKPPKVPQRPITQVKPNPIVKVKKKTQIEYTPLQQDCYDALTVLGMKKKEATFTVNQTFNKYNPSSIQEFLTIALNRPK